MTGTKLRVANMKIELLDGNLLSFQYMDMVYRFNPSLGCSFYFNIIEGKASISIETSGSMTLKEIVVYADNVVQEHERLIGMLYSSSLKIIV